MGHVRPASSIAAAGPVPDFDTFFAVEYRRLFEVLDGQTPIKTIPRHSTREVTRYKAYDSKPTNNQGCQASTEP